MPFVPAPGVLQVNVGWELDGQHIQNTWYFQNDGSPTESSIADFLAGLASAIETGLLPLLSNAIKLVELVGILLDTADAIAVTLSVNPPLAGEVADESAPNNVAYCITFKSAQRGRAHRGRNYVAGLPNNQLTGNTVSSTLRAALVSFYADMASAQEPFGWTMVVVSRFSGKDSNGKPIPRTQAVVTPIQAFGTFDDVVDSQRRRLPGRGR